MYFKILNSWANFPSDSKNTVFLTWDDWNDYSFYTLFGIFYVDQNSNRHDLGSITIGFFGQKEGDRVMKVGASFNYIGDDHFSVGTSEQYYESLNILGSKTRDEILQGLNDIAKFDNILERAKTEQVYFVSFLRSLSEATISGQFRRLANGGVALTEFSFDYTYAQPKQVGGTVSLDFSVFPDSVPATNVHVIIGRNSAGKTYLINNLINAILDDDRLESVGTFKMDNEEEFANVISVSFSAFDDIEIRPNGMEQIRGVKYTHIGLKKTQGSDELGAVFKSPDELAEEFVHHIYLIRTRSLEKRWLDAVKSLYSDPNFEALEIHTLMDIAVKKNANDVIKRRFKDLSSGHKIVLLSITRIIEALQEKTLVLMDEPELHLHPPLLSAFIRTISNLLVELNGVSIIATHSPVVLQEVPKTCVWKLRRVGLVSIAERPTIETFGENVGVLASDVFALEVENSGYYNLLIGMIEEVNYQYDVLIEKFQGQLGTEARSIAMAYINAMGPKK